MHPCSTTPETRCTAPACAARAPGAHAKHPLQHPPFFPDLASTGMPRRHVINVSSCVVLSGGVGSTPRLPLLAITGWLDGCWHSLVHSLPCSSSSASSPLTSAGVLRVAVALARAAHISRLPSISTTRNRTLLPLYHYRPTHPTKTTNMSDFQALDRASQNYNQYGNVSTGTASSPPVAAADTSPARPPRARGQALARAHRRRRCLCRRQGVSRVSFGCSLAAHTPTATRTTSRPTASPSRTPTPRPSSRASPVPSLTAYVASSSPHISQC